MWLLAVCPGYAGQPEPNNHGPSQYDVQAVYLFDFGKFVRWPAASDGVVRICTAAPGGFEQALQKVIAGEQIGGRSIELKHVDRPEEEQGCAILFIDASQRDHVDALLSAVNGRPALTVSDAPEFLAHGGMIQFLLIDDRVRFAVNLQPATRCGLSLSSELLKVAVAVDGKQAAGGGQ